MGIFDFLKRKELDEISELHEKLTYYSSLIDLDKEIANRKDALSELRERQNKANIDYTEGLAIYSKLKSEISLYESKLDLSQYGVYDPVYDFEKSDDYRNEQNKVIERQKDLIKRDQAAICEVGWTIEGSAAQGKKVIAKFKKLMLRAFNGESAALISKVRWNNVSQMKERLNKAYYDINKLGDGFRISISLDYLYLKEKELILEYEYLAKKQEEKELMRAAQEELREEEKARREFEQAQREAEKQEAMYLKALEKARKELGYLTGEEYDKLQSKVSMLEIELAVAMERKERAISMAQQTKRGHVYIISNIGSFGENVYKIGMTRRLDPIDRVRELGDASVPFKFDIHAMIYSDEARTLEYELHKAFSDKKVNMLNYRREFFNVSLQDIKDKISQLGFDAEFSSVPEAMEFRETLLIREKGLEVCIPEDNGLNATDGFPATLFDNDLSD